MGQREVDAVDLNRLTNNNAVVMVSHLEDRRRRDVSVDVYMTLGGCAYGVVLAAEESAPGGTYSFVEPSGRIARLPLSGKLLPGEITLELTTTAPRGYADEETLRDAEWEQIPVACETLELVTRGE